MITLAKVNNNSEILEFIKRSEIVLKEASYTEHGLPHAQLVSDRARNLAKEIGLAKKEQELAAVSAFCHDMGNFLSRTKHHYFGALLFHQIFQRQFPIGETSIVMEAIANHDKEELKFANPISAILVIADKSDVRRSRVYDGRIEEIKNDIHDKVNYATTLSRLKIGKKTKAITLTLEIDTDFVPVMEYFEIFTERMVYCRKAAEYLGYHFGLVINNFKLL